MSVMNSINLVFQEEFPDQDDRTTKTSDLISRVTKNAMDLCTKLIWAAICFCKLKKKVHFLQNVKGK